jgi:hypothetical protein
MPSDRERNSAGMRLLVRTEPLTTENLVALIEARRKMVMSFLDKVTIPTLGDVRCIPDVDEKIPLQSDRRHLGEPSLLDIQGIFRVKPERFGDYAHVWGLGRRHGWLFVRVRLHYRRRDEHLRFCNAEKVEVEQVDLPTLLTKAELTHSNVLSFLRGSVELVIEERKRVVTELTGLMDIMIAEDSLLSLIPKR